MPRAFPLLTSLALVTFLAADGRAQFGPCQAPSAPPQGVTPSDASKAAAVSAGLSAVGGVTPAQAASATGVASGASGSTASPYTRGRTVDPRTRSSAGTNPRSATCASVAPFAFDASDWTLWWEHNKDEFLYREHEVEAVVSGGSAHFTGRGRKVDSRASERTSYDRVRAEIIPSLQYLMRAEDDSDIVDAAVRALGRAASVDISPSIRQSILPLLAHASRTVQWSAVLALGLAGSTEDAALLVDVMGDTVAGRAATGGPVHDEVRAYAALALGFLNAPHTIPSLIDVVENARERDLRAAAVAALGLMENERSDQVAVYLMRKLGDRDLDAATRAFVPVSLGRLGSPLALVALAEQLRHPKTEVDVRRSVIIALGQLAHVSQEDLVDELLAVVTDDSDAASRHFAYVALARIGARDAEPQLSASVHARLVERFAADLARPARRADRSWAALATAIYGRAHRDAAVELLPALRASYAAESDPSFKAASAIALGLLADRDSERRLHQDFHDVDDQLFRGYVAVALGLMNHVHAAESLREICATDGVDERFRRQSAVSLGLMGDRAAVGALVAGLGSGSLSVSSATAQALGLMRAPESVDALGALAFDDAAPGLARAWACAALGLVGEKTELPWNAPLRRDANYLIDVPAIRHALELL